MSEEEKTCSDCGKTPIPRLETVYSGSVIICHGCYLKPPKQITMYGFAPGQVWHNRASGGSEVQYVRADLVDALLPFAQLAREVLAFAVHIPDEHLPKANEVLEGLEDTIGKLRVARATR
jgi:hypothetical protein